jgi:hypothetical protein
MTKLRVGAVLSGFCGGLFGRDSFGDKRVEAIGFDWVVARNVESDHVEFASVTGESIEYYLKDYVVDGTHYESSILD